MAQFFKYGLKTVESKPQLLADARAFLEGHPRWSWHLGPESDAFFRDETTVWRELMNVIHSMVATCSKDESSPDHPKHLLDRITASCVQKKDKSKKALRKAARAKARLAAARAEGGADEGSASAADE